MDHKKQPEIEEINNSGDMDHITYMKKTTEKGKLSTEKKIELLKKSLEYMLTEGTIKNITRQILNDLIEEERYEECAEIVGLERSILKKMRVDQEELVKNVGLNEEQTKKLFDLN